MPSPNWNVVPFVPHANNELLAAMAYVKFNPAATLNQEPESINTGEDLFIVLPSPNWPPEFKPQPHSEESFERIAILWEEPEDIADQEYKPTLAGIWTGDDLLIVVPSPSWPTVLTPHVNKFAVVVMPNDAVLDSETFTEVHDSVPILTGLDLETVVPSPSWPVEDDPHANNALLAAIATVWINPAATSLQDVPILIWTGTDLFTVVPSPNWPEEFKPQAHNVSSCLIATIWFELAAITFHDQFP